MSVKIGWEQKHTQLSRLSFQLYSWRKVSWHPHTHTGQIGWKVLCTFSAICHAWKKKKNQWASHFHLRHMVQLIKKKKKKRGRKMCHLLPQLKFWEWFGSGQRQTDRKRSGRGAEVLCCQHRLTSELESKSLRSVSNQTVVKQRQIFYKRFSGKSTFTAFLRFLYPWFQIEDTSHLTHFFLSHLWLLLLFMHRWVFLSFCTVFLLFLREKTVHKNLYSCCRWNDGSSRSQCEAKYDKHKQSLNKDGKMERDGTIINY